MVSLVDSKSALLVIDVQNDFCPGGQLAVEEGHKVVPVINRIMELFRLVAATQDWHPADHLSFAANHSGKNVFDTVEVCGIDQILWPEHCIAGTLGAQFHPGLNSAAFDLILRKGRQKELDSYSAFLENDHRTATGLEFYLKGLEVGRIFLCGIATDVCVYYSALDGLTLGFEVFVIEDGCRGIDTPAGTHKERVDKMITEGVKVINSKELAV